MWRLLGILKYLSICGAVISPAAITILKTRSIPRIPTVSPRSKSLTEFAAQPLTEGLGAVVEVFVVLAAVTAAGVALKLAVPLHPLALKVSKGNTLI